jgi:hypothetical protein
MEKAFCQNDFGCIYFLFERDEKSETSSTLYRDDLLPL